MGVHHHMYVLVQMCVIVEGLYQLEVTVFGYNNPTGRCRECVASNNVLSGCCDAFRQISNCIGNFSCDSFFVYCLRQPIGRIGRDCSYFGDQMSDSNRDDGRLDFSQSPLLGLENPIVLQGLTNSYKVEADTTSYIIIIIKCSHSADRLHACLNFCLLGRESNFL